MLRVNRAAETLTCLLQFDMYYPKVPANVPLYNLRDVVPEMLQPKCGELPQTPFPSVLVN